MFFQFKNPPASPSSPLRSYSEVWSAFSSYSHSLLFPDSCNIQSVQEREREREERESARETSSANRNTAKGETGKQTKPACGETKTIVSRSEPGPQTSLVLLLFFLFGFFFFFSPKHMGISVRFLFLFFWGESFGLVLRSVFWIFIICLF